MIIEQFCDYQAVADNLETDPILKVPFEPGHFISFFVRKIAYLKITSYLQEKETFLLFILF